MISLLAGAAAILVAAGGPTTSITAGPVGNSGLSTPSFSFEAQAAASFECSFDDAPFTACASPQQVGPLKDGRHSFTVRAVDVDGNIEDPPVTRTWTYVASPLAQATLKLRVPARATMSLAKLKTISGSVSSPSKVTRVQVALQAGKPDKDYFPPACHFFDMRSGAPILQTCVLPPFTTAKGTVKWTYRVPATFRERVKPGHYKLIVRAFNAFNQGTRRDFSLTLR